MKVERKCKILHKERHGDAVMMALEVGDMVRTSFQAPGQFVHIKCGDGLLLRRPISVCLCVEEGAGQGKDVLAVVFEPRGEGTEWLARRPVGHGVDVLGLLGSGFQMRRGGRYLMVGGGIGIPPMLGCTLWAGKESAVILGGRTADKVILQDNFQDSVSQGRLSQVMIATDDGSLGHRGFVDALVRQELSRDRAYDGVLACGPKPMLRNVAKVAAEFGVPCQVSMEERMGCGIGACLVCACDMRDGARKHVCKDGPVFNAEEVDWDA